MRGGGRWSWNCRVRKGASRGVGQACNSELLALSFAVFRCGSVKCCRNVGAVVIKVKTSLLEAEFVAEVAHQQRWNLDVLKASSFEVRLIIDARSSAEQPIGNVWMYLVAELGESRRIVR